MNRFYPTIFIVCTLLVSVSLPVCGDAAKTVEAFRASFEKRMNSELDGHGKKARELRQNYIKALEKLKGELGRQEKLTAAAQVVAEIEAVEDGEQAKPVPENADYRFKRVRVQWDRGIAEILKERNRKIDSTAKLYLKALDTEKRKLTRAGKIKGALLIEQEAKRVKELPEVKAALDEAGVNVSPSDDPNLADAKLAKGDLALQRKGASVKGAKGGNFLIDGKIRVDEHYNFAWSEIPCNIDVDLSELYRVGRIRFLLWDGDARRYRYELFVSADGMDWKLVADSSKQHQSGWQEIEFETRAVRFVRLHGISNTVNKQFHVVELEVFGPTK